MGTVKRIPLRQCIGCGEQKNKKELIRVVRTPEEELTVDVTGRKNGRGAYVCRDLSCLEKALKNRGLERSLKVSIPKEIQELLIKELQEADDDTK